MFMKNAQNRNIHISRCFYQQWLKYCVRYFRARSGRFLATIYGRLHLRSIFQLDFMVLCNIPAFIFTQQSLLTSSFTKIARNRLINSTKDLELIQQLICFVQSQLELRLYILTLVGRHLLIMNYLSKQYVRRQYSSKYVLSISHSIWQTNPTTLPYYSIVIKSTLHVYSDYDQQPSSSCETFIHYSMSKFQNSANKNIIRPVKP